MEEHKCMQYTYQKVANMCDEQNLYKKICKLNHEQKKEIVEILIHLLKNNTICKLPFTHTNLCYAKLLNSGGFGFTFELINPTKINDNIILKFVSTEDGQEISELKKEIDLHNKVIELDSIHFIRIINSINSTDECLVTFQLHHNKNFQLILMEKGGDDLDKPVIDAFEKKIKATTINFNNLINLFSFYLVNIKYFNKYKKYFIHYDIKPDNIIPVGDTYKFIDFGLSMESSTFFMSFTEYHKLYKKFPSQYHYLFKNIKNRLFLHLSPLSDIFCFIIVLIEAYLAINHAENSFVIMVKLHNNFANIYNYEKLFIGIIRNYINLALLIYKFYNRSVKFYLKEWTFIEFEKFIHDIIKGKCKIIIEKMDQKSNEINRLQIIIDAILKHNCGISNEIFKFDIVIHNNDILNISRQNSNTSNTSVRLPRGYSNIRSPISNTSNTSVRLPR